MPRISLASPFLDGRHLLSVLYFGGSTAAGRVAQPPGAEENWNGKLVDYTADDYAYDYVSQTVPEYVSLELRGGKLQPVLAAGWYQVWANVRMNFPVASPIKYVRAQIEGADSPGLDGMASDSFVPHSYGDGSGGLAVQGHTTPTYALSDGTLSLSLNVQWTADAEPSTNISTGIYVVKLA